MSEGDAKCVKNLYKFILISPVDKSSGHSTGAEQ